MLLKLTGIKLPVRCYWLLLLFAFNPCFAQLTRVTEIQQKLEKKIPDTTRLNLLKDLGMAYSSVDPVKKFYYSNVYKTLAVKLNKQANVADAYIQMGISYGIRSKIDSALFYFNLAYNHAKKHGAAMETGRALANMGFAYGRLDDDKEQISKYFEALTIYKNINYELGQVQLYNNIGGVYFDLDKFAIAQSYFEQSLAGYTKMKNETGMGNALYSVANCYRALKQNEKALEYYNRSLTIHERLGDLNGAGLARMGLGRTYTQLKQYNQAITNLDSALVKVRKLDDKYLEANVLNSMAVTYNAEKDYDTAIGYSNLALKISRAIKSKGMAYETIGNLVEAYKGKGDLKNALDYQTQYVLTKDSIREEQQLKDLSLIEINRIRGENASLEKNNQNITELNSTYLDKINRYSTVIIVTLLVLISALLFLAVLYRRNMAKQETNRAITQHSDEIGAINDELELLNEEMNAQMELTTKQNAELERLNDVKNKFFSIISHDLRSPLSTLQTLLAVYREGEIDEQELGPLLNRLEETIINTGTFLDNLLEWSKNQLDGMKVSPVNFNISESIVENIELFATQIGEKKLQVSSLADARVVTHADPDMINLVVRNLLSNSIKFCHPGDAIIFNAQVNDKLVIVSISDNGPGISKAESERLFSLDSTISAGTHGEKGNHLGLILCKDMVEQNGGKIGFETNPGEGTTFWFELPGEVEEE
ncbi:tetratricopeptide repeat-containing sensor histidine kinase [Mucilaginibacter glaciei]|uniref:histidine kinase n=1 Tax=Mucilaginibacter glaciei TaxID=2772109 RepID=A0A926S3L7_9SPHI|nr:tetratricopeptide repeat-containing sensor histidine kinase [Mucilaginibacter glaciei]MBD1394374.1 tetratricopeptide repeat-containing sensor histidine kinase [Mucilaginibacter glaciei]